MNYRINLRTLRAFAKHIAPKVEERAYFIGVQIEFATDGIYYVATDGSMLAAIRDSYDASDTPPATPLHVIVPRDFALGVKFTKHRSDAPFDSEPWAIDDKPFKPVEGAFPDWRRVLPRRDLKAHGERLAQYDGARLARLEACAADIHDSLAHGYFYQNGGSSGVFACYQVPNFLGVLMCRYAPKAGPPTAPEWSGIQLPGDASTEGSDLI